jgi:hypothetical protein
MEGMHELFAVCGIGVIGYIGSTVLVEIEKPHLAKFLDVIVFIAGMGIAIKVWMEGVDFVQHTFNTGW